MEEEGGVVAMELELQGEGEDEEEEEEEARDPNPFWDTPEALRTALEATPWAAKRRRVLVDLEEVESEEDPQVAARFLQHIKQEKSELAPRLEEVFSVVGEKELRRGNQRRLCVKALKEAGEMDLLAELNGWKAHVVPQVQLVRPSASEDSCNSFEAKLRHRLTSIGKENTFKRFRQIIRAFREGALSRDETRLRALKLLEGHTDVDLQAQLESHLAQRQAAPAQLFISRLMLRLSELDRSGSYKRFVRAMKAYKTGEIERPELIQRVAKLVDNDAGIMAQFLRLVPEDEEEGSSITNSIQQK